LMVGGDPYKPVGDPKHRVTTTLKTGTIDPNIAVPAQGHLDDDIPF
jgi:hypothetical protein